MFKARVPILLPFSLTLVSSLLLSAHARASGGPPPPPAPLYGYQCDGAVFPLLPDIYSGLHATMEDGASTGLTGAFPDLGNEALLLDGFGDRVVLSTGPLLSRRPSSSVSAWFFGSPLAPKQHAIYGERDGCGFNVFWVGIEHRPAAPPGLTFSIFDGSGPGCGFGTWHVLAPGIVPAPGVWHHVAAVLDSSSGMKLYLDGALVASNGSTATFAGATSGPSTIGHVHEPGYDGYWPGKLDDVALYAFALTPAEVLWLATHSLWDLPPNEYPTFCPGDGSGTACPCANETPSSSPQGCANSTGAGGAMRGFGNAAVSADTFSFNASGLPTSTIGIFIQGSAQAAAGAGTLFGDGLLCVGGTVLRLAAKSASGGVAYYPHPGDSPLSVRGSIPAVGATRHYQFWYRNAANFCTSAQFNLSNGLTASWTP